MEDKVQMSLVFSNIQKQVGIMRRNIHRLRQEVDSNEKVLIDICQVISEGIDGTGDGTGPGNGNSYGSSTTLHSFIYPQDGMPDLQQLSIAMKNGNGHGHGHAGDVDDDNGLLTKKSSNLSSIDINGVQREAAEWSVVEDDDEDDRELTSASLSGYDDEYDSE